jgi:1-aminocyclopropane-1-carboxylate deaminase
MIIPEINENPVIEELHLQEMNCDLKVFIKRDDLIHPEISGNKWWKLKYNLQKAREDGHDTVLTFGGAFSNHIAATAAAGKLFNFKTIGIIRGEENSKENSTLSGALKNGMRLEFVSREEYKRKEDPEFLKMLEKRFGTFYMIPEGGRNALGVKGCMEILNNVNVLYDFVCCACGTGTTLAGIMLSKKKNVQALGFSALKGGDFLRDDVLDLMNNVSSQIEVQTPEIITDYHFGGYGKVKPELLKFAAEFEERTTIPLDLVYTGKMFFGIFDLIKKGFFPPSSSILVIHSGGTQGNRGFRF